MPLHICSSSQGDIKEFLIEIKMSSRSPFQLFSHWEKIIWNYLALFEGPPLLILISIKNFFGKPCVAKTECSPICYNFVLSKGLCSAIPRFPPCSLQDIKDHAHCLRTKPPAQDRDQMTVDWISKKVTNFWSRAQWDARALCHDQIGFHLVRALLCDLHETLCIFLNTYDDKAINNFILLSNYLNYDLKLCLSFQQNQTTDAMDDCRALAQVVTLTLYLKYVFFSSARSS